MSFIWENILVDPFMADRNSTKRLKPQADLFLAPVQIDQPFNDKPSVATNVSPNLGLMAFIGQALSLLRAIAPKAHHGKTHIRIDRKHKVIRKYTVTSAEVHDSEFFEELLDENNSNRSVRAGVKMGMMNLVCNMRRLVWLAG